MRLHVTTLSGVTLPVDVAPGASPADVLARMPVAPPPCARLSRAGRPCAPADIAPGAFLAVALRLAGGMTIKVKTLTGREIEVDIEPTDTVNRIKERLEEKEGIAPDQQRLIFSGKQMNDDKPVTEYGIEGGSVLHLVIALRGGGC